MTSLIPRFTLKEWMIVLLPNIVSYIMSMIVCPRIAPATPVPAQPPAFVFGIVWPVLYLAIGLSWLKTRSNIPHIALIALLNAWVYFYSCKQDARTALWLFVPIIAVAIYVLLEVSRTKSSIATIGIAGLIGWLIFAAQLNSAQVNRDYR